MKVLNSKSNWLSLLLVTFTLAFAFQGARGIWEPDEGYYVNCAVNMSKTGDFLIPRLNHEIFLDKPPLVYWGIAMGMRLFGFNEWGARFFTAMCFSLTALLVAWFGSSLWDRRTGLLAGLFYATTIIPFAAANVTTPDTPLAFSIALAFYCF